MHNGYDNPLVTNGQKKIKARSDVMEFRMRNLV